MKQVFEREIGTFVLFYKAWHSSSPFFFLSQTMANRRGFPSRFRNWVAILFSTATSRVLLNGITGDPIVHGQSLRGKEILYRRLFSCLLLTLSLKSLRRRRG
jgi:hypothetical protein